MIQEQVGGRKMRGYLREGKQSSIKLYGMVQRLHGKR